MAKWEVNLPETAFPMKADLPKREPQILDLWRDQNVYQQFCDSKLARGKGQFMLHDGPPYANGSIHLGHAFNKIIKDTINKHKRLDGYAVNYVPGWDCHGLPIELNVEKKVGRPGAKVTVEEFIAACRTYAAEQIEHQKAGFERLGIMADWEHFYSTMNFSYEANIVRAFNRMLEAGYVVRGYKPVHWCPVCRSALAEAEVEYQTVESDAIDVKFSAVTPEALGVSSFVIPIWTTTPWTLPANEAVSVHPDLNYALVFCKTLNEHLVVLESLLPAVLARYNESNYQVVRTFTGRELEGIELWHPFIEEKKVPLILGRHVTAEMGTGAVHTAPAHGLDDYLVGKQYHLPVETPVGADGKFAEDSLFPGIKVFDANPLVIELLKNKGKLLAATKLIHSYPHCWRHKTKLIFRATKQWFISLDEPGETRPSLREQAKSQLDKVTWIPEQGEHALRNMVEARPDWCISRQRLWGIPLTLFVDKKSGAIHPEMSRLIEEVIIPQIEKIGLIYWHQVNAEEFLRCYAKDQTTAGNYEKVTDTLDVWFNSGVSHFCVLSQRPELKFPADVYLEGNDQYRGWFQSSLLTSLALNGIPPYRAVITHGFCVDGAGHKMSKSLGNVIDPLSMVERYGADLLRLWAASAYMHDDLAASKEIFERTVDNYRLLRNSARFLLGNLSGFNLAEDLLPTDQLLALDRWALNRIKMLVEEMHRNYDQYQFYSAMNLLFVALNNDLSSFYFSIIKDRLYTLPQRSFARRSAQTTLWHILTLLVRILAPITSFTAEEIWQELRKFDDKLPTSVLLSSYADVENLSVNLDDFTVEEWRKLQLIRTEVNKVLEGMRQQKLVGSSLAAEVVLYVDDEQRLLLSKFSDELRFFLITSAAELDQLNHAPLDASVTALPCLKIVARTASGEKCARCWHYRDSVGKDPNHPELCDRCITNLTSSGETRRFV